MAYSAATATVFSLACLGAQLLYLDGWSPKTYESDGYQERCCACDGTIPSEFISAANPFATESWWTELAMSPRVLYPLLILDLVLPLIYVLKRCLLTKPDRRIAEGRGKSEVPRRRQTVASQDTQRATASESSPSVVLVLKGDDDQSMEIATVLCKAFEDSHLHATVLKDSSGSGCNIWLQVFMDFEQLCSEAEHEALMKTLCPDAHIAQDLHPEVDVIPMAPFVVANAALFLDYGADACFFEHWEELLLIWRRLRRVQAAVCFTGEDGLVSGETLLNFLDRQRLLVDTVSIHAEPEHLCWPRFPLSEAGLDEMHKIFGDATAMYFVFMRTFTLWLIPPSLLLLVLKAFPPDPSQSGLHAPPAFTIFLILWAALLPKFIQRTESHFACRWGRLKASEHNMPLPYVIQAAWRSCLSHICSVCVTAVMMAFVLGVQICSLNLQGYIDGPGKRYARGLEITFGSPFYVARIARFAEPGKIFDPTGDGDPYLGGWITLVPVIAHVLAISHLNELYKHVARILTDRENHKTQWEYKNAMILKRFVFEAFDAYLPLAYIAFFKMSASHLQMELVSLYSADSFRRVLTETVLPLLLSRRAFALRLTRRAFFGDRNAKPQYIPVDKQIGLDPYVDFDDYLEMIIDVGYIVIFGAAFPLIPIVTLFSNIIEVYNDAFKLLHVYRCPTPVAASGMPEAWQSMLSCICWLSVLSNVLMFGSMDDSTQLQELFPDVFLQGERRVWTLFFLQSGLLAIQALLATLLQSTSQTVQAAFHAQHVRRERAMQAFLSDRGVQESSEEKLKNGS